MQKKTQGLSDDNKGYMSNGVTADNFMDIYVY